MVVRPDSRASWTTSRPAISPPALPSVRRRRDGDDGSDGSDGDGDNLEGDDYQYNGGDYEDYDFAASPCISNGPTKIISGLITCLFFTFPFTFPFTFSILHESITEMIKIVVIDEIIPFFIFFHYNPSFSMLGPTIIAWHETLPKQVQEGEGEFHPGQSSQSSDAGGSSFQSGQSSHAAGGHDGSVELQSEDEEEDQMQNMMDEEDEDGVDDELDSDESGGFDNSDDNEEEDPIPSSWNHDLSEAMIVDDRHDSAWEYSMNTISIGARYADKRHLQEAITQWAMNTQRVFRTTVSSQKFLTVVCSNARCPSRVHGYRPKYDTTWIVSGFEPHTCVLKSMLEDHRNLTSTLLARLFYNEIVENTAMGVKAIQKRVHLHYKYEISYGKAWRAKQTALENRFRTFYDAYDGVVRLLQTLKDRNPGTHVDIQDFVIPEFPNIRVLNRVFFTFSICIEAFMHCRPVMCVDGTFLTGRYMGQILTAIGVDGNNRIVPLAFAFVESENTGSWLWFFRQLKKSIVKDRPNVCMLHDRHAGILAAIKTLKEAGPYEETPWQDMQSRWCMRHLGANFFSQFRSKGLMNLFKKLCKQNQECKYTFLRGKLDEFTKDHVRHRIAARAALAAAHAAAVAQGTQIWRPQKLRILHRGAGVLQIKRYTNGTTYCKIHNY
ncbi:hypothetical protein QYE76_008800 [Lolium multiflorum]|uniref:MULE transposase domain-containing protein n=1 Tax=Lolium multiflorum TaxID=4521 RepID=A0AAD8X0B4_LOLMU|nr:hypothetical protein QYE76_008800 [Lolium multiflorum]